ncbi:sugar ABC transporter sugar-binding protein [Janibacter melonis]|uniref:Sugar ABC transporter sugar-binding protein n=1 Tax=Janibacter melonis TaxID=262209 RepID=A0A176QCV8_9MICO|nr:extracellular solute-binding protein [Janibacter melonis]OAB87480.1 sugar ABC transporter sugar-binding protein [Janibacter melonis]
MIGQRGRALALATTLGLGIGLAGCAPSSSESGSGSGGEGGETTLTVWSWRVEDQAAYEKIFDAYEAKNEGVTVDFKTFKATEYNKILATGLSGSDGPDVPQVRSYGQLQPTVASGSLVPLDDEVDLEGWDDNAVASAKGTDGSLYSVPLATQTVQMFYNKGLLEEKGLEVPTSWEDFVAMNDALLADEITPIAVGAKDDWTLPIVHEVLAAPRFGGADFQDAVATGEKDFTDPDWVASVQVVGDLKKYMPKDVTGLAATDAQTMFTSEQAAMIPGGSFDLAVLQKGNPEMEIGTFQVPAPPGSPEGSGPTTAGWSDGNFAVSKKSEHQEEAMELVRWMATKEFGQMVADEVKQLSAVPGVTYGDPVLGEMAKSYEANPSPYLLLTDFRYGSPAGTDLLGTGIQEMLLGDKDATQVSSELDKGVKSWFEPTKK